MGRRKMTMGKGRKEDSKKKMERKRDKVEGQERIKE